MSQVSDVDIGRLIQRVESMDAAVRENNERLDSLENQLERTRGSGIGGVLAVVGVSGVGGTLISRWLNG